MLDGNDIRKIKSIKDEILNNMIDCYEDGVSNAKEKLFLSGSESSDFLSTIIMIFARETLVNLIMQSEIPMQHNDFMKRFCNTLKDEVTNRIKKRVM